MSLADNGSEQLGRCRLTANWIAHVKLSGTQTPIQVARYIRQLMKEKHESAKEKGHTVHPLPKGLLLTSPHTADGEAEEHDGEAPECAQSP